MKLRCKDGDIAVITWDFPECMENIGRLVQVRGPVTMEDGVAYWRIQPVTPELYAFRDLDDSLGREHVTWSSRINHPDGWMIPLESDHEPTGIDETVVLKEPASMCTAAAAASAGTACLKGTNAVMYRLPLHTPAPKQTRLRLNEPPGCLRPIV